MPSCSTGFWGAITMNGGPTGADPAHHGPGAVLEDLGHQPLESGEHGLGVARGGGRHPGPPGHGALPVDQPDLELGAAHVHRQGEIDDHLPDGTHPPAAT